MRIDSTCKVGFNLMQICGFLLVPHNFRTKEVHMRDRLCSKLPIIALILVLLASATLSKAAAEDGLKKVLVLHSYHRGLGWTDSIAQGIDENLIPVNILPHGSNVINRPPSSDDLDVGHDISKVVSTGGGVRSVCNTIQHCSAATRSVFKCSGFVPSLARSRTLQRMD